MGTKHMDLENGTQKCDCRTEIANK